MALKPALFLGLRPTQGSYPFKPFTTSKELREYQCKNSLKSWTSSVTS